MDQTSSKTAATWDQGIRPTRIRVRGEWYTADDLRFVIAELQTALRRLEAGEPPGRQPPLG